MPKGVEKRPEIPDAQGHYGQFGGRYVPETVIQALIDLERVYLEQRANPEFQKTLETLLHEYVGRPTPLYLASRLTAHYGRGKIYFKREDLCHTGAHKINNTIGQGLLARFLKKKRIIAETGAGQHGVATATVAAMLGLECAVYMGVEDMKRQEINVTRMKLLGADVVPVHSGSQTLKDATNEALRDWVTNVRTTYYIIGSVVGPHPYPMIVRDFQSVIGKETREQIMAREQRLPDYLIACVGGGSNSLGLFYEFLNDTKIRKIGVEAAGLGLSSGKHAATLSEGRPGILHGSLSYVLQNPDGQIVPAYSISAGLDYPGVGPEHSYLKETNQVEYTSVTDEEAIRAVSATLRYEGILPALESAHAIAYLEYLIPKTTVDDIIIVNLSGRGEKDLPAITRLMKFSDPQ